MEGSAGRLPAPDLKIDAVDEDAGSVSVSGYVSRADDIAAVKQRIGRRKEA